MAKKLFLSDIDLNLNQILNMKLQNLGSAPTLTTGDAGFAYYHTGDKKAYLWSGTQWINLVYTHPNHSGDVTSSGDGATTIAANVVTNAKMSTMAASTIKGNNTAGSSNPIDLTVTQIVTMLANLDGTLSANSDTLISSQKAVKTYVDTAISTISGIAGALVYKGAYDANANNPNLDSTPLGILKGWTYVANVSGQFFSELLEVGDMVIANKNDPTVISDWTRVNRNIDPASTAAAGMIQLATQSEVSTGTNTLKAVSPATLIGNHPTSQAMGSVYNARKLVTDTIGGSTTQAFTHGMNAYVSVQLIEISSGLYIDTEIVYVDPNRVTFNFTTAPAANSLRAIFIG